MKKTKTIFFGTPEFSVPFLKTLIDASFLDVVAVVTEPDRPKGRGKVMTPSPVTEYSIETLKQVQGDSKIELIQSDQIINLKLKIENLQPDLAVVVAYGQIIPQEILDIPKYGAINVHPSDLPKYRGPAPIQGVLLNGEKETAISVMRMDAKMDHGAILGKLPIKIDENDDYSSLEKKILNRGPEFLVKTLEMYLDYCSRNIMTRTKNNSSHIRSNNIYKEQDHSKATFTKMIKKEDGLIDWNKSPLKIHNKIRAYTLWPKAYTYLSTPRGCTQGKRLNILKSRIASGKLYLEIVQLEGKKPTSWKEFINGYAKLISEEMLKKIN